MAERKKLLHQISSLINDYIDCELNKILHTSCNSDTCMAILVNGNRCKNKRCKNGNNKDHDLCNFHNHPRFRRKVCKIKTSQASQASQTGVNPKGSPIGSPKGNPTDTTSTNMGENHKLMSITDNNTDDADDLNRGVDTDGTDGADDINGTDGTDLLSSVGGMYYEHVDNIRDMLSFGKQ